MANEATKWLPLFNRYVSHLRIQSKHAESDFDGTGIPLKMWTSQRMVLEQVCEGLENDIHVFYILKSRQLGVTTITLAILIFWAAFHPNTILCQVSDNDKTWGKNRITIRSYLGSLASFMGKGFKVVRDNKFGFEFSNGSRIDLLIAGKTKVNWGEGEGYLGGLLTEVASYGKEEGIESFRHAMAPENPRALYMFEGTAKGNNHWKDMCEAADADLYSSKLIFVGWWSNDRQKIRMADKRWASFGLSPPTPEENEKIIAVRDLYGFDVSMEQLAWYRWQQTQPNSNDTDMDQNQPWTAGDAFVQSGTSFFQNRLIYQARERIILANETTDGAPVEDGGYGYRAYSLYFGDDYHMSSVEEITTPMPVDQIKMRVWEKSHPEGQYVIGVDPAGGRSEVSNNHSASVWRCYADKMVQVAEWADSIPETRHCAWMTAYLAGLYPNCRINIDLTGGIGSAVMQAFDDLRSRMRSDMYQDELRRLAEDQRVKNEARRLAAGWTEERRTTIGHNGGPPLDFEDFLSAANWYLYRRIDSPGPGFMYNTKLGLELKYKMMNMLRDSWVSNLMEIRSVPLLDEMSTVVQTKSDIGASAPGRQRDDRTFAMALANFTWIENLRGGLISQGITWEGSRAKESGAISPAADLLNRRVYSIMRAADEAMDLPPPMTFFERRGL